MSEPLKLIALDSEDLAVVSAHMQDAVLTVGDMAFLPQQRRFAALANRFDWDSATKAVSASTLSTPPDRAKRPGSASSAEVMPWPR